MAAIPKPKVLDGFSGAGGASVGYSRAGFDVVGIDIAPQPRYPFPFILGDFLVIFPRMLRGEKFIASDGNQYGIDNFQVFNTSPPCQAYSISRNNGAHKGAPKLIEPVREVLRAAGKIYVIENVYGAPLVNPVQICGASFGLGVLGYDLCRHRYFETNVPILSMPCQHRRGHTIGVYGNGTNTWHLEKLGRAITFAEKRTAMGIEWMTLQELNEAVPPAYTEWFGGQIMAYRGTGFPSGTGVPR